MRYVGVALFLLFLLALLVDQEGGYLSSLRHYVENREVLTLEANYSPEQILQLHKQDFTDSGRRSLEPELKFAPYLLMEVKWRTAKGMTKESAILFSLSDGEMVLDTNSWEKTHGFQDTLNAGATAQEFLLLNILSRAQGSLTIDQLQKTLKLEPEKLDKLIQSTKHKHLTIQRGNEVALHFQHPHFHVHPETYIHHWLVSKPNDPAKRLPHNYTPAQIERLARAAFGSDFTIRSTKEVSLPLYQIQVVNPDNSILTTYWNALNGQPLIPTYGIANF
ncbi:MAG: hypothetical protein KDK65_06965 [Chlamydiia bacterium]|nr:hypothetical protein [Chlamydiia bacterium]